MAKTTTKTQNDGPSKMDMVRAIIDDRGQDIKPKALIAELKARYGVDMPGPMASTYKGTYLKQLNGGGSGGGGSKAKTGGGVALADVKAVADLVKRLGSDQLAAIAAAVG